MEKRKWELCQISNYALLLVILLVMISCRDNLQGRVDRQNARIDTMPLNSSISVEYVDNGEIVDKFLISNNMYRRYVGTYMPENRGEMIKITADSTTITVKKYAAGIFSDAITLKDSAKYYIHNLKRVDEDK